MKIIWQVKKEKTLDYDDATIEMKKKEMHQMYYTRCEKGETLKEKAAFVFKHNNCKGYADLMANTWQRAYTNTINYNRNKADEEERKKMDDIIEKSIF